MTIDKSPEQVAAGLTEGPSALDFAHDALNRMSRAHKRGTGCYLTAKMIRSLSLTFLAQTWGEGDPRRSLKGPKL